MATSVYISGSGEHVVKESATDVAERIDDAVRTPAGPEAFVLLTHDKDGKEFGVRAKTITSFYET